MIFPIKKYSIYYLIKKRNGFLAAIFPLLKNHSKYLLKNNAKIVNKLELILF